MNYLFHPEAEAEFLQAIEYYEDCAEGLGYDFSVEVCSATQRVTSHPKAWPMIRSEVRRCLVSRFPFGVLYAIHKDEVFIVAVMHLHRSPDYWTHRIDEDTG